MPLHILLVDDEQYRHDGFRQKYRTHNIAQAWSYDHAKALLDPATMPHKFDLILLDHDLGYGPNGFAIARDLIATLPEVLRPTEVRVHSMNWSGAQNIVSLLRRDHGIDAYHQPFDWNDCKREVP